VAVRVVLPALLLLAIALLGATALRGRGDDGDGRVGLNTHLVWAPGDAVEPVLREIRAGGVRWVREELAWRLVEPEEGRFEWDQTDNLMAAASRAGVDVLGILAYSATWASADPAGRDDRYPPRDPSAFARYARAVVARYGRGGAFWDEREELDPRPLRAVEIWNEPWTHSTWRPDPDPAAYARLVRAATRAIRDVAPDTTIAIAGDLLQVRTDGKVVEWLGELLRADPELPSLVDVYTVHPYPDPRTAGPYDEHPDGRWDYGRVELVRAADDRLPIWITEVGWSTAAANDAVSESVQARYVEGAVARALDDWGAYVERIFVYSFDRDSGERSDREGHYGLRRADGTAKPAWAALQALSGDRSG
jgi:polysaccharide biosynthesis protein PslG